MVSVSRFLWICFWFQFDDNEDDDDDEDGEDEEDSENGNVIDGPD